MQKAESSVTMCPLGLSIWFYGVTVQGPTLLMPVIFISWINRWLGCCFVFILLYSVNGRISISFFGAVSFPVPPSQHSASLPVLWKNQLTSPFFIDLGKRTVYQLTSSKWLDEDN
ncbi:unnamed protein product [Trifolium pratense]|uniref:Uncharacterized protein n=1 Tax=Trifolium pratense TaxID=57577 RepID=A0ACB0K7E4_TRIPR|nr:unnamed protein product [Trifolium pratense]